ncbi:hypothetical protein [Oceanimonas baumannii]|uniref:Uncharacterized protein n=1 Tax=Oceanimonas baumannii TaxID=129578 RepID=A0A235CKL9_9GAMM|nr:hypothetical protein [Oceanimonas baumannii]OYD24986.1 hypothetical protein B6S09_07250 [Oceanimonas baumannii]TDW59759.1 hypothetical protein LY04_01400 [Oceanimonas baumannii]
MEDPICNWTPQLIVELIKNVAWPIVVLVIGVRFRGDVSAAIRKFFTRNTVSEVSATTSGVSAKFVAAKQSSETLETAGSNSVSLPKNMGIEAIRERHLQQKTEFSEDVYSAINTHLSALNISDPEKTELLMRELSLLQCAIRYFDINKVLFRSQFNLFSIMANNAGYIAKEDAHRIFISAKEAVRDGLLEWDWIKYIAYPVSNGLMSEDGDGYKLTPLGKSYVAFMSKNPQLVDDLAKL